MTAHLMFTMFTFVLMVLAEVTGLRQLLNGVADDRVVTIVGCIALLIVASALTIGALRLQRGWSPG